MKKPRISTDRMPRPSIAVRKAEREKAIERWSHVPPPLHMVDTIENRYRILDCILVWLMICEQNGRKFPEDLTRLRIEMGHSALLRRLMAGKNPLPEPPPKSFSYPWYELIENGFANPVDVWETKGTRDAATYGDDWLFINQSRWPIVRRPKKDEWIVKNIRAPGLWRVWCSGVRTFEGSAAESKRWSMEKFKEGKK